MSEITYYLSRSKPVASSVIEVTPAGTGGPRHPDLPFSLSLSSRSHLGIDFWWSVILQSHASASERLLAVLYRTPAPRAELVGARRRAPGDRCEGGGAVGGEVPQHRDA